MNYKLLDNILEMEGYVPGEQPQGGDYVKLNTNENPYPPSTAVYEAIAEEFRRLRLYPQPMSNPLREAAAEILGFDREWILAGNGSDDLLMMFAQAFLSEERFACAPVPTYTLYRTLAQIQNSKLIEVPFAEGYELPAAELQASGAVLAFLANPNSPTGTMVPPDKIADFARAFPGFVLLDEAYADFADANCLHLVKEYANIGVMRTFSKSYALAGLRVGLLFARPEFIEQLAKVKDSYNLDRLAIVGAAAALRDRDHFNEITSLIKGTRGLLTEELTKRGFDVLPSQSNFVMVKAPEPPGAKAVYLGLKERKVLVRYFEQEMPDHLRITVGTDVEVEALLTQLDEVLKGGK